MHHTLVNVRVVPNRRQTCDGAEMVVRRSNPANGYATAGLTTNGGDICDEGQRSVVPALTGLSAAWHYCLTGLSAERHYREKISGRETKLSDRRRLCLTTAAKGGAYD